MTINTDILGNSVVDYPKEPENRGPIAPVLFNIARVADEFTPWGMDLKARDSQLRSFWPSEPLLASAVYSMAAKLAVLPWHIRATDPAGPPPKNTIRAATRLLQGADRGNGWATWVIKTAQDVYTQDNAGFTELIRAQNRPDSPVLGIAHLDSMRCYRTGDPETPYLYLDRRGRYHALRWWNCVSLTDLPSPVEDMYGAQVCALTRCLRAAQIIRDIAIYKKEKVSGQFARAIHFISGVTRHNIEDAMALAQEQALNMDLTRYAMPPVIPTINQEAQLSSVTLDLASLPDGFDEETTMRWYITQLAIAFGVDYQEFAPLPGGNLGSGSQSEILHMKARGKGPALLISAIEHMINNMGILPRTVEFVFTAEDDKSDEQRANARYLRGRDRSLRVKSGELTPEASRLLAIEDGDLPEWIAEEMPPAPASIPASGLPTGDGFGENPDPLSAEQIEGGMQKAMPEDEEEEEDDEEMEDMEEDEDATQELPVARLLRQLAEEMGRRRHGMKR